MKIYLNPKQQIKLFFVSLAAIIVTFVLFYTNIMVKELIDREKANLKLFAELYQHLGVDDVENAVFINDKLLPTISYPMIITLQDNEPIFPYMDNSRNIKIDTTKHIVVQKDYIKKLIRKMDADNPPIDFVMTTANDSIRYKIHFTNSDLVNTLQWFPLIEVAVVGLFMFLGYISLSSIKRGEESKVWVGMAKEAAHQLGTPLSSMLAWIEIIKYGKDDPKLIEDTADEMQKDIDRLSMIATRFSKIGSTPELSEGELSSEVNEICNYFDKRLPVLGKRIDIIRNIEPEVYCCFNKELFAWVIENLLKNAAEAIEEKTGTIMLNLSIFDKKRIQILITDNGKGMNKKQRKQVFLPGYTTKKRGWGLGLSLSKRIVEEYHSGKIYVKDSAPGRGTTFLIELPMHSKDKY